MPQLGSLGANPICIPTQPGGSRDLDRGRWPLPHARYSHPTSTPNALRLQAFCTSERASGRYLLPGSATSKIEPVSVSARDFPSTACPSIRCGHGPRLFQPCLPVVINVPTPPPLLDSYIPPPALFDHLKYLASSVPLSTRFAHQLWSCLSGLSVVPGSPRSSGIHFPGS